jgi:hypothetical protein
MQIQDLRRKMGENRLLIWPLRVWTSHEVRYSDLYVGWIKA